MPAAFDIKQDENDLYISSVTGDFVIEESDKQHIEDILVSPLGAFKEFPFVGIGIENYSNASINPQDLERLIKIQLKADKYTVSNPKVVYSIPESKLLIRPNALRQ